jgi:hypothetical protein
MFILIFYVAHWLACIWYYIGTLDCNQQHGGLEASCGWVIDGLSSRFENHSMITDPLDIEGGLRTLYVINLFEAVKTLISGSTPMASLGGTVPEMLIGCFGVVVGGFVYGESETATSMPGRVLRNSLARRRRRLIVICGGRATGLTD